MSDQSHTKHPLKRQAPAPYKLEARLMFDGAAIETLVETGSAPVPAPATEASPESSPEPENNLPQESQSGASGNSQATDTGHDLLIISGNTSGNNSQQQKLDEAESQLHQHLHNWFASSDFEQQAQLIFSGNSDDPQWQNNLQALQQTYLQQHYSIQLDIRSDETLSGALGAYSATGTNGSPTIYLNGDWLDSTSSDAIAAVLLEEIGHDFDQILNNGVDTQGDEGHHFASLLLYGTTNSINPVQELDQLTLEIDGYTLNTEAAAPANIVQTVYVPISEADMATALDTIANGAGGAASGIIANTIAIAPNATGTVVVYDHWEDGYELDLTNPLQASTLIWGGGDLTNGIAPGTADDLLVPGQPILLQNNVDPGTPVANDFDARDKIGTNQSVNVSRVGWDTGIDTDLAGAVKVTSTSNAGTNFILPIGEDVQGQNPGPFPVFEYTSLHISAFTDGTNIDIDTDGDGTPEFSVTLNEGETYFVDGGVLAGATVSADQNIAVYAIAGQTSNLGNYWLNIAPVDQWSDSYYTPVGSVDPLDPQALFLYNPSGTAFDVNVVSLDASGLQTTTTVNLAANSVTRHVMPDSGAHIFSVDGETFYAVTAQEDNLVDWGFPLISQDNLSSELTIAWAPGDISNSATENPVWVTPVSDTRLLIDSANVTVRDADGVAVPGAMIDADTYRYNLTGLESYRIYNTAANFDLSGLRIYTEDGTLIAAAYGTDPSLSHSLDIGSSILPNPDFRLHKTWEEFIGDGDNDIDPGEQIQFTLIGSNTLNSELTNLNFTDTLPDPAVATYIPGSATLTVYDANGAVLYNDANLDGGTGNFPLDGAGYNLIDTDPGTGGNQGLQLGQRVEISYLVQVAPDFNQTLVNDDYTISVGASMSGDEGGSAITPRAAIADVTVATPGFPSFDINDSNGVATGDISVLEGSSLTGESFLVFPLNNLTSIDINGTEVVSGPYPIVIGSTEGTLTITGYDASSGEVSYNYTPAAAPKDHSGGEIVDSITITITDNTAETASETLDILILDDAPVAVVDNISLTEALTPVSSSGNIMLNDSINTDTPVVVSGIAVGATGAPLIDPLTVGVTVNGSFGDITVASNGTYTYNLDINNNVVKALNGGQSITDVFTYTLEDSDGSTSFNTIQVTINGINDNPTITIPDINGANVGEVDVEEDSNFAGVFLVTPLNNIAALTVNSTDVTTGPYPVAIPTAEGTITITSFDQTTGVVAYNYDPTGNSRNHTAGAVIDNITIRVVDGLAQIANNTMTIQIVDTAPVAVTDANNITEATLPDTITGNVITGVSGPDDLSGDLPNTVVGLAAGNTGVDLSSPATVGVAVPGSYGTLTILPDGSYTYVLDNTLFAVQALNTTQSLVETFTYTLGDTDGSLSSTTLDITIDGTSALPVITINDDNAADSGDISIPENETLSGQFNIQPLLPDLSVLTVGGTDLLPNTYPVAIITTEGTLTITAYDGLTGDFSYDYTPSGLGKDHSAGEVIDSIIIDIADRIGNTANDTLDILITDTIPTAVADQNTVVEDDVSDTVSGNVITDPVTGDLANIDGNLTIAGVTQGDTGTNLIAPGTVNRSINGAFGSLRMAADGSYSYTLDNTNTTVTRLNDGEQLTEVFTYTLIDGDGSAVNTTLSIVIEGITDPPNIFIEDPNPILQDDAADILDAGSDIVLEPLPSSGDVYLSQIHNLDSSIPSINQLIDEQGNSDLIADSRNLIPRPEQLTPQAIQFHEQQAREACQLHWLEKFSDAAAQDLQQVERMLDRALSETDSLDSSAPDSNNYRFESPSALPTQTFATGSEQFSYAIPADAFRHGNPDALISYSASMADGSELPEWLEFDPQSGEFTGTPPEDFIGELMIKVIARDESGQQVETLITLRLEPDSSAGIGSPSFSDQLRQQNLMAWKSDYEQRIDTARTLRMES
ncbi:MAG: hypothetical protein AseanaTS_21480 [Candidatus Pelagadaptatus aseana]|uniref:VCBS domain-containing protein n=1 Tax=Candidatus Pelagadaptatus aseana TaxID=3120508 RepID=UPI0039B22471